MEIRNEFLGTKIFQTLLRPFFGAQQLLWAWSSCSGNCPRSSSLEATSTSPRESMFPLRFGRQIQASHNLVAVEKFLFAPPPPTHTHIKYSWTFRGGGGGLNLASSNVVKKGLWPSRPNVVLRKGQSCSDNCAVDIRFCARQSRKNTPERSQNCPRLPKILHCPPPKAQKAETFPCYSDHSYSDFRYQFCLCQVTHDLTQSC